MNALLALHPCKAFGRSTSGIHARPRKRVRFCCSVKPSQLWWGLLPIRTINEIFRTIPITKLASLVKGRWIDGKAQTVASLRLLAIYPHFLFAKLFCRQDGGIVTPPTLPKPHYPSKIAHTLALLAPVAPNTANFASIFLIQYTNYG